MEINESEVLPRLGPRLTGQASAPLDPKGQVEDAAGQVIFAQNRNINRLVADFSQISGTKSDFQTQLGYIRNRRCHDTILGIVIHSRHCRALPARPRRPETPDRTASDGGGVRGGERDHFAYYSMLSDFQDSSTCP